MRELAELSDSAHSAESSFMEALVFVHSYSLYFISAHLVTYLMKNLQKLNIKCRLLSLDSDPSSTSFRPVSY